MSLLSDCFGTERRAREKNSRVLDFGYGARKEKVGSF
jgi:hypothetical protein